MSEYETVYLFSEYINRTWAVMQFWASVSFGLIALAHFASKHLNVFLTLLVSVLYAAFSVYVMVILRVSGVVADGFLAQLQVMVDASDSVNLGTQAILASAPTAMQNAIIVSSFFGVFVGALLYLWVSVVRTHRKQHAT
ncbi:hypothetical protein QWI17_06500 [Gilvimarinus sp. SDUM040013]|uniref:Uncharacterized protein n=1 Tax=Gilvimarinus gilvus TaxID=3058038 RepID=A0ABU4S4C8_9GAMM|nr:hypothetical protein [Gilvimarinus sp. SDUM040013]MDO3385489.1 hypothetical protein [Gilvimarinus sp. SDUM040013]MDX6851276.1 hypothetical protein [Gilvimarinus sp. SDUM040013]